MELFTDTAAILNLLDLRSIMVYTGGTRSVFTLAFWAKRKLHCIFLGEKAIIISRKAWRKIGPKSARKYGVIGISDRAHAPWASYNTS